MAEIPAILLVHRARIQGYQGENSIGVKLYDSPRTVSCFRDEKIRVIRNTVGEERTINFTLFTQLNSGIKALDLVAIHGEFNARVIAVNEHTDGGLGAWQHLEVLCEGWQE